jgi:hypothetical protein
MRIGTFATCVAIAGLVAMPQPAAAQASAAVFKPTGQWALDYGDDYCRLARTFSDGKNDLALAVERIEPGPSSRLILISDAIKPFRSAEEIAWHFIPGDPERKARYTHSTTADGKQYYNLGPMTFAPQGPIVRLVDPSAIQPPPPYDRAKEQAAAKALTGFVLDTGLTAPVEVETGDLSAPVAALQACADDLAKSWGLDPAKLQTQSSAAIPDGGGSGWLPQGTVGFGDFGKLGGGANQVRLMVDAAGKATSCTIHWPTLDATTNDKICKAALANAKFTPAKDASGQSMPGYWMGSPLFMGPPFPSRR